MKERKTIAQKMVPMGRIRLMGLMGLILPMLLMVSCSSEEEEEKEGTLAIVPISSSYYDVMPWDTRAANLPTNYEPYDPLTYAIAPKHTNIGVWLTPDHSTTLEDFVYKDGSDWRSMAKISASHTYYIYGYMPHTPGDNASIAPLNGNYANGAVLTLSNHPTLTEDDLSVLVGVRKGSSSETIETLQDPLRLGNFQYIASADDQDNILFVLLKHIYAGLRFSARIDPEYHKVREIYVTKVDLTAHHIYQTGTVEVTLTANASGTDPSAIKYTPNTAAGWATINLYEYDRVNNPADKGYRLDEAEPTSFIGCFAPGGLISDAPSGSSPYLESYTFTLTTTYDVYDKKGNLIRKGCTAENKIDIGHLFLIYNENAIQPGYLFTINLKVQPTYLYMLSEPDLDNPKIEIE